MISLLTKVVLSVAAFIFVGALSAAEMKSLAKKAADGNATAQYQLAEIYAEGIGIARNSELAVQFAAKSAVQGNPKALYRLAALVFEGKGAPRDVGRATGLFKDCRKGLESLAEKGDADAQSKLGVLLARGLSGPPDVEAAQKWTLKSAEQGFAKAQYDLGSLYLFGRGVKKDLTVALKWFEKGAAGGHPGAQVSYGIALADGFGTTRKLKEARIWLGKAAKSFDPDMSQRAKEALARIEAGNINKLPDVKKLNTAAEKGEALAQYQLARVFRDGKGVPQNLTAAHKWFERSAKQGDAGACHGYGGLLINGLGCKKDVAKALKWWRLAANSGLPAAQADLGLLYSRGEGDVVKKDHVEAYKWFTLAARSENTKLGAKAISMREELSRGMKGLEIFKGIRAAQKFQPVKIPTNDQGVKEEKE